MIFSSRERERYDRQIMLPEVGERGQEKLKNARAVIVGAGGLGSPAALYLAAAGIGGIRLIDHDTVELSNLNRQILHGTDDIGQSKITSAAARINALNPHVILEIISETVTADNVSRLVTGSDLIVDALDNLETRFVLNRAAIAHRLPFFHGAVSGFKGRAMTIIPYQSACLGCLYKGPVKNEKVPVVGVASAVIGSILATEALKYLLRLGDLLTGRLLIYDGLKLKFDELQIKKNPQCEYCGKEREKNERQDSSIGSSSASPLNSKPE